MLKNNAQFREKFIAKVPQNILEGACFTNKHWEKTFNISSWIRFHNPGANDITLLLKFIDAEGAKESVIDHCCTELETTVLLSAKTLLKGRGKVTEMSFYLQVSDNSVPYVVDELFIQNANTDTKEGNQNKEARLISVA